MQYVNTSKGPLTFAETPDRPRCTMYPGDVMEIELLGAVEQAWAKEGRLQAVAPEIGVADAEGIAVAEAAAAQAAEAQALEAQAEEDRKVAAAAEAAAQVVADATKAEAEAAAEAAAEEEAKGKKKLK